MPHVSCVQASIARSAHPEVALQNMSPAPFLPQMLRMSPHLAAVSGAFHSTHLPEHTKPNNLQMPTDFQAQLPHGQHTAVHAAQASEHRSTAGHAEVQQSGVKLPEAASRSGQASKHHASATLALQQPAQTEVQGLQRGSMTHSQAGMNDAADQAAHAANCSAKDTATAGFQASRDQSVTEQPAQTASLQLEQQDSEDSANVRSAAEPGAERPQKKSRRMTRSAARASLASKSESEGSGLSGTAQGRSQRKHRRQNATSQMSAIPEAAEGTSSDVTVTQPGCSVNGNSISAGLATAPPAAFKAVPQGEQVAAERDPLSSCTGQSPSAAADEKAPDQWLQDRATCFSGGPAPASECEGVKALTAAHGAAKDAQAAESQHAQLASAQQGQHGGACQTQHDSPLHTHQTGVVSAQQSRPHELNWQPAQHLGNQQKRHAKVPQAQLDSAESAQVAGDEQAWQAEAQQAAAQNSGYCQPACRAANADTAQPALDRSTGATELQPPGQAKKGRAKRPPKPKQPTSCLQESVTAASSHDMPAAAHAEPAGRAGSAEPASSADGCAEVCTHFCTLHCYALKTAAKDVEQIPEL